MLATAMWIACSGPPAERTDAPTLDAPVDADSAEADADADGFTKLTDCDDERDDVYPGADELCDGTDNDCDGLVDDDDTTVIGATTWYRDDDGDGHGDAEVAACLQPDSAVTTGGDCDDGDPATFPGAPEACDGADDDCDGLVDNSCTLHLVGRLTSSEAHAALSGPCVDAHAQEAHVADADGDALADVWTDAECEDENRALVSAGPFAPSDSVNWETDTLLAPSEGETLVETWPTDANEDGRVEALALVYGASGSPSHLAYFFRDLDASRSTGDADLALFVEVPEGYAYDLVDELNPGIVASANGNEALAIVGSWYGDYDWCAYRTWIADASDTGQIGSDSLYDLGPSAAVGSDCYAAWPRDAGDLDGDGDHELLLEEGSQADLYWGPFVPTDGFRDADARLAGIKPSDADYAGPTIHSVPAAGDLDQDGTATLLASSVIAQGDGTVAVILAIEPTDGGLAAAAAAPVLYLSSTFNACLVGPALLDINGDGWLDIAAGDTCADVVDRDEGMVFVEYGPFEGVRTIDDGEGAAIVGEEEGEYVGTNLSAGDTNGDGYDELVLGTNLGSDERVDTTWIFLGGP